MQVSQVDTDLEAVSDEITLRHMDGLHARPSTVISKQAKLYESRIAIAKLLGDGTVECEADAKSIFGLLTLAAINGCKLRITAIGSDAKEAVEGIIGIISRLNTDKECL